MPSYAAVDLGASSGRVMLGTVHDGRVELLQAHRFVNEPVRLDGTLHWDILRLWAGVTDGIRAAGALSDCALSGIGIDSWAVDYGLLDGDGALIGNPVHYRDDRTTGMTAEVETLVCADRLYERTGVFALPFNTIYQWIAAREDASMTGARAMLLIPDLFGYWLTGARVCEETNASTTGLLDVRTRDWSIDLLEQLSLPPNLLSPVVRPGTSIGAVTADVAAACGIGEVPVIAVGSHDTASAVVGVPATRPDFAYISCGTWSLVGVELDEPVTSPQARAARFSNELGVDNTVRFLRNVMGLWLLQESQRQWRLTGESAELAGLLAGAAALPDGGPVFDTDLPQFLPPGDMPARIRAECARTGQAVPSDPVHLTRCILDSLAATYGVAIGEAVKLSGVPVSVVHIVGGGAQNELLCALTADACGLPVIAGPVEAAALGNVLVQARATGALHGDLMQLRQTLTGAVLRTYLPEERGSRRPR